MSVVGWISLCNGDFVLEPPYEKLLEKARSVVDAGIDEGLLDPDDVDGGMDPSVSFCVNHWIERLEEAGLHMPEEEVDGGPGMSDTFFDIRLSDASDKRALTGAIEGYIDLIETRLEDLREAKEAAEDDVSRE